MRPSHSFLPQLESLEDRQLLATSILGSGNALFFLGDKQSNSVQINETTVPVNGVDMVMTTVTVDGRFIGNFFGINAVYFSLGKGNDRVSYTYSGPSTGRFFSVSGDLGDGNDSFTANLDSSTLTGSNYVFNVTGGDGNDNLAVSMNNTLPLNIDANSSVSAFLSGGNGDDRITTTYRGELDGVLNLVADGSKGRDLISATFNLADDTPGSARGRLNAAVFGGRKKDNLTMLVTESTAGAANVLINALVDGGKGKNTINASGNVTVTRIQ